MNYDILIPISPIDMDIIKKHNFFDIEILFVSSQIPMI